MAYKNRALLRGIRYRCVQTAVAAAASVLLTAGNAWAMTPPDGGAGELCMTRRLEAGQEQDPADPPEIYQDENGKEYSLDHWEVVTVPGRLQQKHLERQVVYTGVEGAEKLPESIAVEEELPESIAAEEGLAGSIAAEEKLAESITMEEEAPGMPARGNLNMEQSRILKEEWQDGFALPVTFHSYGADEYHAGSLVIQGGDILGSSVAMGGELLKTIGLSPLEYRVLSMEWEGEPYEDQDGQLCRQALVSGQKLVRDYEITYEGDVSWTEPDTYELVMTYKPLIPVQEPMEARDTEKPARSAVPAEEGALWYWVRSGFVITVGAGLVGIAAGLLVLLVLWYRQNRREHRKRYLPQIKG